MKALLIASDNSDAHALIAAIRRLEIEVEHAPLSDMIASVAVDHSSCLLFPQSDGEDLSRIADICRRLRIAPDRTFSLVAIAHDTHQLDTLVEAGVDDFLLWPAEVASLTHRLDICAARFQQREREVLRSRDLVQAVHRAELGEQRSRRCPEGSTEILMRPCPERRARQELLASEEHFRAIVERITELVCRYTPDGTLTYVNEAYGRAFGVKPEDLVGKSFFPLLPDEDRLLFEKMLDTLSPTNPVAISVHRAMVPSGELRWQEWYDRGIFDDEGRLVEIVGTARDITDRRSVEQELADAGNFVRDVLDAVRDPITVEGGDGNFVMVNRAFAELVGQPRDSIVGRPVTSLRRNGCAAESLRWPDVSDEHEITWPTTDGQSRSLFEKRAVLADRKGHKVLVSVMRDVTERNRYEAQLALSERLASLGTLAAGIAHEINNPLSYVIGNVAFAIDNLEPARLAGGEIPQLDEIHKALSEAREGAQRIAGIVRDVRVFSRADRDSLQLVQPVRVVDTSLRMVQTNLERRATILREIDEVPHVLANEARLAQVVVNLLTNAMQALPERSVQDNRIVIAVRSDQRVVTIEVRDNGQGISEENLRRIFDPFFTTKPAGEGMGLGLSICNSIIIAHGGRIDVESTLGGGSSFRIVIPVAPSAAIKRSRRP